ncbi:MAG: hypothetical protein R8M45_03020 [Ghiorsea sp.]
MAIKKGNDGVIMVGGAVVAEVKTWSYNESVGSVKKPEAMGDTEAVYASSGVKDGSGSLEFIFDPADVPQAALAAGASIALVVHESGTAVGGVNHTGTVLITSIDKSGGSSDFLSRTASFSGVLLEGVN